VKIVVGTRGSELSLIQTQEVLELLKREFPDIDFQLKIVKTLGDIDQKTPLYKMGAKGIFVKALDRALLSGEVDIAIHSAKDYPTEVPPGIAIAAITRRVSPFDVFISSRYKSLQDLPPGSTVGTSSLRRLSHVKYLNPYVEVVPVRGNVDTRVRKLEEGLVDALIVAEAGIIRLGLSLSYTRLDPLSFTPAAGQGALIVTVREDDEELKRLLAVVNDESSSVEVTVEREVVRSLHVGCHTPLGVYARVEQGYVSVVVSTVSPDFKRRVLVHVREGDPRRAVERAVEEFRTSGGLEVLDEWRRSNIV